MLSQERLTVILDARDELSRQLKEVNGHLGQMGTAGRKLAGILGPLGASFAAWELAGTAVDMARLNTEVARATLSFEHFSGGAFQAEANLRAVQRASGEALDEMQSMQLATAIMTQNLAGNATELERMVRIARGVATISPVINDMDSAVSQLSLTISNTSWQRLDQLGTSAGEVKSAIANLGDEYQNLSKEQKFQIALLNTLEEKTAALLDSQETQVSGLERLSKSWRDSRIEASRYFSFVNQVADQAASIFEGGSLTEELYSIIDEYADKYETLSDKQKQVYDTIKGLGGDVYRQLARGNQTTVAGVQQLIDTWYEAGAAVESVGKAVDNLSGSYAALGAGGMFLNMPGQSAQDAANAANLLDRIQGKNGPGMQYKIELFYDEGEMAVIENAISGGLDRIRKNAFDDAVQGGASIKEALEAADMAAAGAAVSINGMADSMMAAHQPAEMVAYVIADGVDSFIEAGAAAREFETAAVQALVNIYNTGGTVLGLVRDITSALGGLPASAVGFFNDIAAATQGTALSSYGWMSEAFGVDYAVDFANNAAPKILQKAVELQQAVDSGAMSWQEAKFRLNDYVGTLDDGVRAQYDAERAITRTTGAVGQQSAAYNDLQSKVASVIAGAIGPVAGVDANDLLPREDAINENARRLADIAVNGLKGQDWMGEFASAVPNIFEAITTSGDPQMAAAQILRDFQDGLRPELIDTARAKELVLRAIRGDESTQALVNQVAQEIAREQGIAFEEVQRTAQSVLGGGGGEGSTSPIVVSLEQSEKQVAEAGKKTGKTYGDALLGAFSENVPEGLISILTLRMLPSLLATVQSENSRTGAQ